MKTRVLIVDDSPLIRAMLRDILSSDAGIEVIGLASDGIEGVDLAKTLKPDVITMDVEMPRLNGLQALAAIMRDVPTPVIMLSTLTSKGANATMEALELGAFDLVCKPNNGAIREFRKISDELLKKVRAAKASPLSALQPLRVAPRIAPVAKADRVVVIASSTGGPRALAALWRQLPNPFPAPILMVQHMPPNFTASLAQRLNSMGTVPCREAKAGVPRAPR